MVFMQVDKMKLSSLFLWYTFVILVSLGIAEDAANDDANQQAQNDDGAAAEDNQVQQGDDYIRYWGQYALLPKRCIVYNDVDVIVFSVFEHSYKQCSDEPVGTYIVTVPVFVNAFMKQIYQNKQDQGNDDYAIPDSIQYTECQQQVIQNNEYFTQLGCTDGTSQSLSVNLYSDNTCTTRDIVDGYDDSNIDVSDLQIPFKQCQACVNWVDVDDDNIDDQFYENRGMNAPLCSTTWQYKEECNRKCQKTGLEKAIRDGWNTSDKILLAILSLFGMEPVCPLFCLDCRFALPCLALLCFAHQHTTLLIHRRWNVGGDSPKAKAHVEQGCPAGASGDERSRFATSTRDRYLHFVCSRRHSICVVGIKEYHMGPATHHQHSFVWLSDETDNR